MISDKMSDLEEIKKAVSTKQFYEPVGVGPLPHEVVDVGKMAVLQRFKKLLNLRLCSTKLFADRKDIVVCQ